MVNAGSISDAFTSPGEGRKSRFLNGYVWDRDILSACVQDVSDGLRSLINRCSFTLTEIRASKLPASANKAEEADLISECGDATHRISSGSDNIQDKVFSSLLAWGEDPNRPAAARNTNL